jgi:hypothetical protein
MSERLLTLKKLTQNEALIEAEPSLPLLQENVGHAPGGSIYYGTGVTTPKAISVGLPFDTLGMVFTAEKLRRACDFDQVFHHIADTHAATNDWIDEAEVDRIAAAAATTLKRVTANLGLTKFRVVRSSSFDSKPAYLDLVQQFDASAEHEYVRREMADMEWYRTQHDVRLKIGWIIQARSTELGFDERRFDREYLKLEGPKISFLYCKPGRTFDPSRPKASPYVAIAGESRLMLAPGLDVAALLAEAVQRTGDQQLGGARKHLSQIVRLYEQLFEPLGKVPTEEKLQHVLDACFTPSA